MPSGYIRIYSSVKDSGISAALANNIVRRGRPKGAPTNG